MERIQELALLSHAQPEREYDPEDPNTDAEGYVWVISVWSDPNTEKLYVCTDGSIR